MDMSGDNNWRTDKLGLFRICFGLYCVLLLLSSFSLCSVAHRPRLKKSAKVLNSNDNQVKQTPHPLQHEGHLAYHIIPLESRNTEDPVAFLENIHREFDEKNIRYHAHHPYDEESRDRTSTDSRNNRTAGERFSFVQQYHNEQLTKEDGVDGRNVAKVVIPMTDLKHSHFVGPALIGTPPQKFNMIYDTGSANVQVVCVKCMAASCLKVHRFDPSKSLTFTPTNPAIHLAVTFGTGQIHSDISSDTVSIGPFTIKNQSLGLIDDEGSGGSTESNVFDRIDFEGIVGFGFPSLATRGRASFFDNLINNNEHANVNEFSIYMGRGRGLSGHPENSLSAFLIGGVDSRFYEEPIKMVPVLREHYWEVGLDSFWIDDYKFCCDEETRNYVIIDSGTSFNTLPFKDFARFRKLVPHFACAGGVNSGFMRRLPTLTYKLTGGVDVVLTPDMYIITTSTGNCTPAFMQLDVLSKYAHTYVLGSLPFMRHYFTLFRRSRDGTTPSMVGIAKAKHSTDSISFLQSLHESGSVI